MSILRIAHDVAVQITDQGWEDWYTPVQWQEYVHKIVDQTLTAVKWFYPSEISILLTDSTHAHELNLTYRGQNKPTNVLSFPALEKADLEKISRAQTPVILGDIVISLQTVLQEIDEQKKYFLSHMTHLIVHGTLHLLGYDHENDQEAEQMEAIEVQVLSDFGIANPYQ